MPAASSHPTGPFANFDQPDMVPSLADDRDLDAVERLFVRLRDEARSLRADARVLGGRIERLGAFAGDGRLG
jgi:hypothetical protein